MLHSEPESETGLILSQLMNVDVNISPLVAEVLYDFEPNESDEIGLIAGQTIVILEKGSFTTIYKIYLKKDLISTILRFGYCNLNLLFIKF